MFPQKQLRTNTKDLFFELIKIDFKLRYNNSVLGFVWVLLKPFLLFLILYTVFTFIFLNEKNYGLNLLLGILLFSYFSEGTTRSVTALTDKAHILLKVDFPRTLTVFVPVANALINFLFGMLIFIIFWLVSSRTPLGFALFSLARFLPIVALLTLMIVAFAFFLSLLFVRFRDLHTIWELLMNLLFYATPIMYPITIFPENIQRFLLFNPLAIVITEGRRILVEGVAPHLTPFLIVFMVSAVFTFYGYIFFQKNVKKMLEYL